MTLLTYFQDRIRDNVMIDGAGCWIWQLGRVHRYGSISVPKWYAECHKARAHRVSYEAFVGPIPTGLEIDHKCRVTLCVNPAHLEPVTGKQNMERRTASRTHCKNGHEYTPENTYVKKERGSTARVCRTCVRGWQRAKYARRMAARRAES